MVIELKYNQSTEIALKQIDANKYVEQAKLYVAYQLKLKREEIDQYRIIKVRLNLAVNGVVELGTRT
jgi:hypothetical protein